MKGCLPRWRNGEEHQKKLWLCPMLGNWTARSCHASCPLSWSGRAGRTGRCVLIWQVGVIALRFPSQAVDTGAPGRGRFRIAPIASLPIADAAQQPNTMLANKSAGLRLGVVRSLSYTRPAALSASRADRVGRSQALPKARAASVRTLSTTPSLRNSSAELSKERELGAKEETNDVTAMDRLLKESRMAVESPMLSQ